MQLKVNSTWVQNIPLLKVIRFFSKFSSDISSFAIYFLFKKKLSIYTRLFKFSLTMSKFLFLYFITRFIIKKYEYNMHILAVSNTQAQLVKV